MHLALLALLALAPPPRQETVVVRVMTKNAPRALTVRADGGTAVSLALCAEGRRVCAGDDEAAERTFSGALTVVCGEVTRRFDGVLRVTPEKGELALRLTTPLESYVAGVVEAEAAELPPEAMKALAVVVRTFARFEGRERHDGLLCDLTHCQVFRGRSGEKARAAAQATAGEILRVGGAPVPAYFHAESGGRTSSPVENWGGTALSHLSGVDDSAFEIGAPHHRWRAEVPVLTVTKALGGRDLVMVRSPGPGHGAELLLETDAGPRSLNGYEVYLGVGRAAGWGQLRSPRFTLRRAGDRFVFEGEGLGHLVGLSQFGAARMSEQGYGYRAILSFYFPGVTVGAGDAL